MLEVGAFKSFNKKTNPISEPALFVLYEILPYLPRLPLDDVCPRAVVFPREAACP